jgi:hypothetical protein
MDYKITEFREWLSEHTTLSDAFTIRSLRILVAHMLGGGNYRSITEQNTKDKLVLTYLWIQDVIAAAKEEFGNDWRSLLLNDLNGVLRKTEEQKYLISWLSGLPLKTATNLDIDVTDANNLRESQASIVRLLESIDRPEEIDSVLQMLMSGAATLTVRGSDKSKIGKQVERVFIRAALTILGFTLNQNFWSNLQRDEEVERETDAEVLTRRGRLRIEVGLIMAGNQEVIEDKIGRVGRNGIIIFDKIGIRSNIRATAAASQVRLIQIRDSNPLQELHQVLQPVVEIELNAPPQNAAEINQLVIALPDAIFQFQERIDQEGEHAD